MSPRKSHEGRVPRWLYKSRGTRTRQVVMGPYDCPVCGVRSLIINLDKKNEKVLAKCSCGFLKNLAFRSEFEPVDYYGKLIDEYYKKQRK